MIPTTTMKTITKTSTTPRFLFAQLPLWPDLSTIEWRDTDADLVWWTILIAAMLPGRWWVESEFLSHGSVAGQVMDSSRVVQHPATTHTSLHQNHFNVMTKQSLSQSNDRKEYVDGNRKDTYCHTNEENELRQQCGSNWQIAMESSTSTSVDGGDVAEGILRQVIRVVRVVRVAYFSSWEPPARDGQGALPINDADCPGTLHRA
jgi:hypothetical protein